MRRLLLNFAVVAITIAGFLLTFTPARSEEEIKLGAGIVPKAGVERTKKNQFKRNPPWRIAISMPGVGNSWIVQMLEETKYEASRHKEISEFIVVDAEWNPAKQVADLEDLLTKNVDAIIVFPVTPSSIRLRLEESPSLVPVSLKARTSKQRSYRSAANRLAVSEASSWLNS
jgi:ribose transport system substrate-binding protein